MENKLKDIFSSVPFLGRNGQIIVEQRQRFLKCKVPFNQNKNHLGQLYAGAIYQLAESIPGGLFMLSFDMSKYFPLIYKQEIEYIQPVQSDIYLEVSFTNEEQQRILQEMETKGKSNFIIWGQIVDSEGKVVAKSKGMYQGRSIKAKI